MTTQNIKLAAVQLRCEVGQIEKNLAQATWWVERAAAQGAQVIVLPELTPGGYTLTGEIWPTAETFNGVSVDWLKRTARRLGIFLGTSFLEAEGEAFYNSFALATPWGDIAGRVRKNPPASAEAYFFRCGDDRHFIDTALGRIGVGICYETLLYERLLQLYHAEVNLVLLPMSAATPTPVFPFRVKDTVAFDQMLKDIPTHYAKALGVPVAMANKCGPLVTPLPGILPSQRTRFPGLSTVVDSDATQKSALNDEVGMAPRYRLVRVKEMRTCRPVTDAGRCRFRGSVTFSHLRRSLASEPMREIQFGRRMHVQYRIQLLKTPDYCPGAGRKVAHTVARPDHSECVEIAVLEFHPIR